MKQWQQQCAALFQPGLTTKDVFDRITQLANTLNFEYVIYALEGLLPVAAPRSAVLSSLPDHLRRRLRAYRGLNAMPPQKHARVSSSTILWPPALILPEEREFWHMMGGMGFTSGATIPCPRRDTALARLTLVRCSGPITDGERLANQGKWEYLAAVADMALRARLEDRIVVPPEERLSPKETEVLCHAADGLSAEETAACTTDNKRTVIYYRNRAMRKLGAKNLTEAVMRASLLGMLTMPVRVLDHAA